MPFSVLTQLMYCEIIAGVCVRTCVCACRHVCSCVCVSPSKLDNYMCECTQVQYLSVFVHVCMCMYEVSTRICPLSACSVHRAVTQHSTPTALCASHTCLCVDLWLLTYRPVHASQKVLENSACFQRLHLPFGVVMRVAEGYQSIWNLNVLAGANESFVRLTLWFMRTWQFRSVRKSVRRKNGSSGPDRQPAG